MLSQIPSSIQLSQTPSPPYKLFGVIVDEGWRVKDKCATRPSTHPLFPFLSRHKFIPPNILPWTPHLSSKLGIHIVVPPLWPLSPPFGQAKRKRQRLKWTVVRLYWTTILTSMRTLLSKGAESALRSFYAVCWHQYAAADTPSLVKFHYKQKSTTK